MTLKQINQSVKDEIVDSIRIEDEVGRRCLLVKFQSGRAMEFTVTGEHLLCDLSTLVPKVPPINSSGGDASC